MTDKEYKRQYYEKHREELIEKARVWYLQNRDLCIERAAKRNKENRDARLAVTRKFYQKHKERWAKWRAENPDKVKRNSFVWNRNRIARKKNATGKYSLESWLLKVTYHGWRCFYCRIPLTRKTLTADHRKPLTKGGTNWLANLVPACKPCNSKKYNK